MRPGRALAALAALAVGSTFAGCAESPQLMMPSEVTALHQRLEELERRDVQSQLEIVRLRKRIADLESQLREPGATTPDAPAAATAPARQAMEDDEPLARPPAPAIEESDLAESDVAERSAAAGPAAGDAVSAYESALRQLRDGRPADAETALRAFASRYSDSDLADNAWFWIGESLRVRNDLSGALEAYRTAIDRYPEGNKIPDTLLKMGIVLELEGRRDAARESWAQLVRRYPDTAAAESARDRLAQP